MRRKGGWNNILGLSLQKSRVAFCLVSLILLLAMAVRLPQIEADAPGGDLSRSGDFLSDEGTWAVGALRWTLTGNWHLQDAYNPNVATPVFMLFQYALCKIFGVKLVVLRYGAVFCSLIMIGMLYGLLRSQDRKMALTAAIMAAVNFPLVIFNRLAFLENTLLVCMLAAAIMLNKIAQDKSTNKSLLLFWLLFSLGYFVKATMLLLLPVFCTIIWLYSDKNKFKIMAWSCGYAIAFALLAYFIWIIHYIDDWRYFQQLNITGRFSLLPLQIMRNYAAFLGHLKLFEFMPMTYLLALFMLVQMMIAIVKRQSIPPLHALPAVWLFWGIVYLGFFAYSPPRYSLLLLLPIFTLSAIFFAGNDQKQWPQRSPVWIFLFLAIVVLAQCAFSLWRILHLHHYYPSCFLPWLGWPTLYLLWRYDRGRMRPKIAKTLLATMIFCVQFGQIVRYHATAEYSLHHAMKKVAAIIHSHKRGGAALIGDSAPLMAIEANVPVIDITYRREKLEALIPRLSPCYLFLEDANELSWLRQRLPAYFDTLQDSIRFTLMHNYTHGRDAVFYWCPPTKK